MIEITEVLETGVEVVEVVSAIEVVEVLAGTVEVVEIAGQQGVPGPVGPQGAQQTYVTAQALGGHRAVRVTAGGLDYADCTDAAQAGTVVGITTAAVAASTATSVASAEVVNEPSWTWIADVPVIVGLNGVLTQTLPVGAAYSQVIGVALSATSLLVHLQQPILTGE